MHGFQIRDKQATTRELIALTVAVRVGAPNCTVIVDDRVDVALAAHADGVHLGADDLPVASARGIGPGLLIGATCRNRSEVEAARDHGADYAGIGPVFATASKQGLPEPIGAAAVADAAGVLPLIAIGGVDLEGARAVRNAGAHGVAVISAIWQAPDPVAAAKTLVAAVS
ncbi:MAG: thiamine phosphate synthase [Solirubrobacterales bacterium]|nr:thiamine phosphate synthase [Solirubrobacterales bacterium]